jgi:hypothetical protein
VAHRKAISCRQVNFWHFGVTKFSLFTLLLFLSRLDNLALSQVDLMRSSFAGVP